MKKLLFALCVLLGTAGAWASTVKTVTIGTQVTDVATLDATKDYVLMCCGTSKYPYYNTETSAMAAQLTAVYEAVVQLNYDGTNVTIKNVSTGQYYQGLANQATLTLGDTPVNYTFNTDGVDAGQFRFASNDLFLNRGGSDQPIGASTSFVGANSRWNIFEVSISEEEVVDFDPDNLSGKTFTMHCARGYVYGDGSKLAGTTNASQASEFAIVAYDNDTYLYDATNKAFVCHTELNYTKSTGNIALESNGDFSKAVKNLSFGETGIASYPWYLAEDVYNTWLNMDGGRKMYMNTWTDFESGNGGNTYKVEIVDDAFDPAEAVALLDSYFRSAVRVMYNFEVNGQLVSRILVEQAANSEVAVPSGLTDGYSPLGYDFTTEGTIGTSDCTITVMATLKKGVVTDLLNLNDTLCYTLTTARGSLGTNGERLVSTNGTSYTAGTFGIIRYGSKYYLYSVADGKFVSPSATLTDDASALDTLAFSAGDVEPLFFMGMGDKGVNVNNSTHGLVIDDWTDHDAGNQYVIVEAAYFDPEPAIRLLNNVVNVDYIVYYNGERVEGIGTEGMKGSVPQLPEELNNRLFTYTTESTTVDDTVIAYEATWNGLFEISESYEDATWYYLRLRDNNYVTYMPDGEVNVQLPDSYTPNDEAAQWAFIGNPYTGLTIINRAAGPDLVLGSSSIGSYGDGKYGGNTYATLADAGTQVREAWKPVYSTYYDGAGFFLCNEDGHALNRRNTGNLAYWTEGRDQGSTFRVEPVIDNYYSLIETEVLPFIADGAATDVLFTLPKDIVEGINFMFESQLKAKDFDWESYKECADMVADNIILPEDGKYYVIKNVSNGGYINVQAATNGIYADQYVPIPASVVKCVVRDGKWYFASQGQEFGWCNGPESPALLDAAEGGKFAHFKVTVPGQTAFAHALGNGVDGYESYLTNAYYAVNNGNVGTYGLVVGGKATDANAQWIFEEAGGITMYPVYGDNDWMYRTFYAPFDVTLLDGAKAYKVAVVDGTAVPTELGRYVPAGTPVLLVSTRSDQVLRASVGFDSRYAEGIDVEGNELEGSYLSAKNFEHCAFDVYGFYIPDSETILAANFAYLPHNDPVAAYNLDTATGIAQQVAAPARTSSEVYDLAGRRVQKTQRGVYISGGKKAVLK